MTNSTTFGLYQRLRNVFGSDFRKVKPKDHKHGIRTCDWESDETSMCLNDALVFITGSAFCAEHTIGLVDKYEKDEINRLSKLRDALVAIGLTNIESTPGKRCAGVLANRCCQTAVVKAGGIEYCLDHGEFVLHRHHQSANEIRR